MIFESCDIEGGAINKLMKNVVPGKKEGFASHKTHDTATGSEVYCLYKVNNTRIHIVYSAPYDFNIHSNYLALAITSNSKSLNFNEMYWKPTEHRYVEIREYYRKLRPTETCRHGFCLKGAMGSSHKPEVHIKLYAQMYDNASPSLKNSMKDMENAREKYAKFMDDEFET